MTQQDDYVSQVLAKYAVTSAAEGCYTTLEPSLRNWAGAYLSRTFISGSYAKGTAIRGSTDLDIFISLRSNYPNLNGMYDSLYQFAFNQGWFPRRQNVSVGIQYLGVKIDLVPGRIQEGYQIWHSLHKSKTGTRIQTNVETHIKIVKESGRINEIRALKIWRNIRKLEFPSFYLELMAIEALKYRPINDLAKNVITALEYLANNITSKRIVDPVNTANVISDDLSPLEKMSIATAASNSAREQFWKNIIS